MTAWSLVALGLLALIGAGWLRARLARGATQALGTVLVAIGLIALLRRAGWLPGHGPRRWTNP